MKNTLHRLGAGTAVAALLASATSAGAAFAVPAGDVLLLTVPADDVEAASETLGDLDIVSAEGDNVIVLGDQGLADKLEKTGASVTAESYADSLGARPASAQPTAPAPVPAKLNAADYDTFFNGYRTTSAYAQFAKDLASQYPELVQHVDYGDTFLKQQGQGGHDLVAVRITADVADQPEYADGQDGKPRFFLGAQTHSREIITSEMAWRFATELIDGYGTDAQITSLLDSTEVWVSFQHNPDSIDVVEQAFADGVDTTPAGDGNPNSASKAWQRKNQNTAGFEDTGAPWSRSQPGIDLNRNWPYGWGAPQRAPIRAASSTREPLRRPNLRWQRLRTCSKISTAPTTLRRRPLRRMSGPAPIFTCIRIRTSSSIRMVSTTPQTFPTPTH